MPDLLLELLSEEIPARMQVRAAEDLRRLVTDALVERGLLYEGAVAFATPRRLALHVAGLPVKAADVKEERRGPRVGAPAAALEGFLRSAGVSADKLRVVSDPKKGDFHVADIEKPGRPTPEVIAEILPPILRAFPWPKSMRWGAASAEPGSLRWVRPLQSILCTFGQHGDGYEVVHVDLDGIVAADETRGHRFLAPQPIQARSFEEYAAALLAAKVVLDPARRREIIRHDAQGLAFAQGLEVVEDEALLAEVAGLVEWPVVLMGSFDESYLALPPEVIRATIRANQKCFVLRPLSPLAQRGRAGAERRPGEGASTGETASEPPPHLAEASPRSTSPRERGEEEGTADSLAPRFILVSNIEASDGGAAVVAGNERVVRARLSDAKFFWDTDRRIRLEDRLPKLGSIVFHEKLGTQGERVERIAALARELAPLVGADPDLADLAERAARLAKADLVTEMVGEFPELQGLMGRYYAAAEGEDPRVAAAIEDHYRPLGPADRVPSEPVTVAVALADKLDTLVGFWAIDEKPTGSKDPYALRRAALGMIRLVLENGLQFSLLALLAPKMVRQLPDLNSAEEVQLPTALPDRLRRVLEEACESEPSSLSELKIEAAANAYLSLLAFFHDRLKVHLRERGARHDLIDAVLGADARPTSPWRGEVAERSGAGGGEGAHPTPDLRSDPPPAGEGSANDDLLAIVRRVEALGRLLGTEDGRNLLAATKRAANILRIEEKKDGRAYREPPDPAAFAQDEERTLAAALAQARDAAGEALGREDYEAAMRALAELRPAVDAFFDRVTVNDPDPALRANRLRLLNGLREATRPVADFSRIEG